MVTQSLIVMGGCALALAALRLMPRWVQLVVLGAGSLIAGVVIFHAVIHLDGGMLLGGLMLLGGFWGLDAILRTLRRNAASPSGQAPGGATAPGEAGKRDGERHAPRLLRGCTTAGRAGRPRSFSEMSR
jgi:hypothetical protein